MIGNDVVDLNLAGIESNWRRRGFMDKVFLESEQQIIQRNQDKDVAVWVLWSMKEAAYKAHQRKNKFPRRLDWKALECGYTEAAGACFSGGVQIQDDCYYTTSEVTAETVFTVAKSSKDMVVKNGFFLGTSKRARRELISEIAGHFKLAEDNFSFMKNKAGVPFLTFGNKRIFTEFSLSGHGKYAAFSHSLTDS